MKRRLRYAVIAFLFLTYACIKPKQQQNSFDFKPPKVVEARIYKVPKEKIMPAVVIPATGVRTVRAGMPEIIQLKSNVFPAKPVSVTPVSTPSTTPKNYQSPLTVAATDSPFLAGLPEVLVMNKDFYTKDENAESFSSMSVAHGLKYAEVNALMQDRAGNIWIATWDGGGVSKYDGRTLTNYSVAQGLSSEHAFSL
jgi:hypothetical protein